MASYTSNLNLKKPAGSENVAIGDINNNMDIIDQAYGTLNSKIISTTSPTVQQLKDAKLVIVYLDSSDGTQHNAVALKDYYWNNFDIGVWTGSQYQHTYCQVQWSKTNGTITVQTNHSDRGQDVTVSISYYILFM